MAESVKRRWDRRVPSHAVRVAAETESVAGVTGEALNLSEGGACLALQAADFVVGDDVIVWLSFARP
ncbi:MAG TPA: PilZ domain-containing protein, partial [Vicinamibacteria bacterium]